jgi:hypothetical protein
MELNKEKKMKSEQAVLPNPWLEEEENNGSHTHIMGPISYALHRG